MFKGSERVANCIVDITRKIFISEDELLLISAGPDETKPKFSSLNTS